jgi:ribosomal protein S26
VIGDDTRRTYCQPNLHDNWLHAPSKLAWLAFGKEVVDCKLLWDVQTLQAVLRQKTRKRVQSWSLFGAAAKRALKNTSKLQYSELARTECVLPGCSNCCCRERIVTQRRKQAGGWKRASVLPIRPYGQKKNAVVVIVQKRRISPRGPFASKHSSIEQKKSGHNAKDLSAFLTLLVMTFSI